MRKPPLGAIVVWFVPHIGYRRGKVIAHDIGCCEVQPDRSDTNQEPVWVDDDLLTVRE